MQKIESKIYEVRNVKVMLDFHLAELYEVDTKVLNQAVKRNFKRFPSTFMFRLGKQEWLDMRSQIVTASTQSKRNVSSPPFAFTEHGVVMLASVLSSEKAIQVNIAIVEAFIALRTYTANFNEISEKLIAIERKYNKHFKDIYAAINYLLEKDKISTDQKKRKKIGY